MLERGCYLKKAILLFIMCFFVLSCLTVACKADSQADASSAITDAQQRIVVCYSSAASAAKAGANVAGLLSNLTVAGNLLSNATLAYENGDYNSSEALAVQSQQVLMGFEAQAEGLKTTALHAGFEDFDVNIVGSLVGAVVVIICAFIIWFPLKKRYKRQG